MAELLERLKDKSILFLEDNIEFANNTTVLFDVFVKNVHHAVTISEAEKILQREKIDIIISDIKLKQENGLDFITNFRTNDPRTPIIILSGHKDQDFLFRAIPLKLTAYLLKPIKYDELINALRLCSEAIGIQQKEKIHLKEGWYYNTKTKTLEKEKESLALNKKEALFMELIAHNCDRLITKEMIYEGVWEFQEMSDSAVTNFILRIRRRFGKTFIYTIPDLGYRFSL
jgi:two-component system, OmpR family, response regulator VanR